MGGSEPQVVAEAVSFCGPLWGQQLPDCRNSKVFWVGRYMKQPLTYAGLLYAVVLRIISGSLA